VTYPAAPWNMTGQLWLSLFKVRAGDHPDREPGIYGVALVKYEDPSPLTYHELLVARTTKNRAGRGAVTITDIWVDSPQSVAGGRELWAIPKGLATLDFTSGPTFTATAATSDDWIATAAFKRRPGLPLRIPTSFEVVQERDGLLRTPVGAKIGPRPASADWSFNPDGPLGYLDGRRPVASLELPSSELRFGA